MTSVWTWTVLVVDDEAMVRRTAVLALQRAGFKVLTAGDAAEALALTREHPEPIHVLVMDVILAEAHGYDVAPGLVAIRPDMKVVYMSGYPGFLLYEGQGIAGPFLNKPFTPEELVAAVETLIRQTTGSSARRIEAAPAIGPK